MMGSSGNLGAVRLADLCHVLVEQCRAATLNQAMEQVEHIASEYDRVETVLTSIRHAHRAGPREQAPSLA